MRLVVLRGLYWGPPVLENYYFLAILGRFKMVWKWVSRIPNADFQSPHLLLKSETLLSRHFAGQLL